VNALEQMSMRVSLLQERLVSAVAFSSAAAAAAMVVPPGRQFMLWVSVGAAGWAMVELARLCSAGDDRRRMVDELILAGSSDSRCDHRRAQLRSAELHHALARTLRQTCARSHARGVPIDCLLDRSTVHAVEDDIRQLADLVDRDAGHVAPEAAARIRILVASSASPLYTQPPSRGSSGGAIRDAHSMINRCRADVPDRGIAGSLDPRRGEQS
jgi:hypothetical protein